MYILFIIYFILFYVIEHLCTHFFALKNNNVKYLLPCNIYINARCPVRTMKI